MNDESLSESATKKQKLWHAFEGMESTSEQDSIVFELDISTDNIQRREQLLDTHLSKFEELFSAGFEATEKHFSTHSELLPIFVHFCWKRCITQAETNEETNPLNLFINWSNHLLCAGRNDKDRAQYKRPDAFLQHLKEAHPTSSSCGFVWKKGEMIVSCKDCGMDPTCAICMPCFLNGNHKGHDYKIHKSAGGVCDCGDPQAWQPTGFCKVHSGTKENLEPQEYIPIELVRSCQGTLKGVLDLLSELVVGFLASFDQPDADTIVQRSLSVDRIQGLLLWINAVQAYGEVFVNMISRELGSPTTALSFPNGKPRSSMDVLIAAHVLLPKSLRKEVHDLYYKLLPDYTFKRVFLSTLINYYPQLLEEDKDSDILALTVQLLTVPSISLELVKNNGLLDVLLKEFYKLLSSAQSGDLLDCSHLMVEDSLYWKSYADVKYVITNVSVSQWMCYHDHDLFSKFLRAISVVQGCVPHTRQVLQHIERELPWLNALNLELQMLRWVDVVIEGFQAGPSLLQGNDKQTKTRPPVNEVAELITLQRLVLGLWWEKHPILIPGISVKKGHIVITYDLKSLPVSMQLPLHRTLAYFLEVALCQWSMDASAVLQLSANHTVSVLNLPFIQVLIEEPLRLHALMAQIHAKMWVRNGWSMFNMAGSYEHSPLYSHRTRNYDIFLLQLAAVTMGAEHFLFTVLERFGVEQFFMMDDTKEGQDMMAIMAERFITFLLSILTDRTLIGASQEQVARRYVIHKLCIEEMTHSKLVESIPKHLSNNSYVDKALEDVATYQAPDIKLSGTSQGRYRINAKAWEEFEGRNFNFYTSEELQSALSKFNEHCEKTKPRKAFSKLWPLLNDVNLPPAFKDLPGVSQSYILHSIVFAVLRNAKYKKPHITEPLLSQTLQLLYYCLRVSTRESVGPQPHEFLQIHFPSNDIYTNVKHTIAMEGSSDSILSILLHMKLDKDFKEHHSLLEEILSTLSSTDEESNNTISQFIQKAPGEGKQEQEDQEKLARMKKSQERQKALLAQFAAQQKAFQMEQLEDEEEEEDLGKVQLEIPQCALCREHKEINEDYPISQVCYVESSRSVEITNRINNNSSISAERLGVGKLIGSPNAEQDESQRNLDHRPGARISSCGHYLHSECFQRYHASLVKRHLESGMYEGRGVIDIELGEFLCPTCRAISNLLMPATSAKIGAIEAKTLSLSDWSDAVKQKLNTEESKTASPPTKLEDALQAAALRVYLNLTGKKALLNETIPLDQSTAFAFWSAIIHTIGNAEVSARREERGLEYSLFLGNKKLWGDLFYWVNAVFHFQKDTTLPFRKELFGNWWGLVCGTPSGKPESQKKEKKCHVCGKGATMKCSKCRETYYCSRDCQSKDFKQHKDKCVPKKDTLPLLSLDLFATFVRMAFTFPHTLQIQDLLYLVEVLLPAVVVQGVVTFYNSSGEVTKAGESKLEETPLQSVLTSIHSIFKGDQEPPSLDTESLAQAVKDYCLPFLRRAAFFVKSFSLDSNFNRALSQMNGTDEFSSLSSLFKIEGTIDTMLQRAPVLDWINDLHEHGKSFKNLPPPQPFRFIKLEHAYEEMLSKYNSTECNRCHKKPQTPALCLCCGTLLCVAAACCRDDQGTDCIKHMKTCSEKGLYFLVKDCAVFVARRPESKYGKTDNVSGYFAGSLYLDKYGEEDPGFTRGKPLFLDNSRFEQLRNLYLTGGGIDGEVVKRGAKVYKL